MTDRFDDGPTDPFRTLDPDIRQQLHDELTGDELVAAVYADPDNDEPRLVYGDYLIEHEDPRGEFVQLQLARRATDESSAREVELFKQYAAAWVDPLFPALVPESIVFERGFLARCRAKDDTLELRDLIGHPRWITVEQLASREGSLVTHPCLRSLRRLSTSTTVLAALARATHAVKVEEVKTDSLIRESYNFRRERYLDESWRKIFDVGALVAVRSLTIDDPLAVDEQHTGELLRSKLGRQLTALAFTEERCVLAGWDRVLREHPTLRRITIAIRTPRSLYQPTRDSECHAAIVRDDAGSCRAIVEIGEAPPDGLAETLLSLPADYRTLTVVTQLPPDRISRLTAQLAERFELIR